WTEEIGKRFTVPLRYSEDAPAQIIYPGASEYADYDRVRLAQAILNAPPELLAAQGIVLVRKPEKAEGENEGWELRIYAKLPPKPDHFRTRAKEEREYRERQPEPV